MAGGKREREKNKKGGEEKKRGERGEEGREAEQISHDDFVWHQRDFTSLNGCTHTHTQHSSRRTQQMCEKQRQWRRAGAAKCSARAGCCARSLTVLVDVAVGLIQKRCKSNTQRRTTSELECHRSAIRGCCLLAVCACECSDNPQTETSPAYCFMAGRAQPPNERQSLKDGSLS